MYSRVSRYVAELIGTFVLVFLGTLAVGVFLGALQAGSLSWIAIAFAHGIALLVMVYTIGRISGCHINPAVSVAALAMRKIKAADFAGYVVFQLIGAALAGAAHAAILPQASSVFYGLTLPSALIGGSELAAFGIEALLTFILVFVILNVDWTKTTDLNGLAIGGTLFGLVLVGGPLTGAAVNPARTFGPAIASGNFAAHAVYWIGPIIGALVAVAVYYAFLRGKKKR